MIVASHASEMQLNDSLSYFSKPAPCSAREYQKVDDECVIFWNVQQQPNDYLLQNLKHLEKFHSTVFSILSLFSTCF